jgi:hypothetical protein
MAFPDIFLSTAQTEAAVKHVRLRLDRRRDFTARQLLDNCWLYPCGCFRILRLSALHASKGRFTIFARQSGMGVLKFIPSTRETASGGGVLKFRSGRVE